MIELTTRAALAAALADETFDPDLRKLIENLPGSHARVFVIVGGDTAEIIEAALGFPLDDDEAEASAYTSIKDHGLWFQILWERADESPMHVFLENGPATELTAHAMCLNYFWTDGDGEGA